MNYEASLCLSPPCLYTALLVLRDYRALTRVQDPWLPIFRLTMGILAQSQCKFDALNAALEYALGGVGPVHVIADTFTPLCYAPVAFACAPVCQMQTSLIDIGHPFCTVLVGLELAVMDATAYLLCPSVVSQGLPIA
ncbi:hypothetical protein EVG20_g5296 [Dentipellis fragilis]|uniref:Uncharacterized protein n=1 Tax=Dentipellis fragilis TaxID=205917 RepID=A0A4Y9YXE6_9AGAM|nr:hypothetical protein EVG20_g5296 [Dentipellis fragilis]